MIEAAVSALKKDFLGFYSKSITDKENIALFDISDTKQTTERLQYSKRAYIQPEKMPRKLWMPELCMYTKKIIILQEA